MNIKDVPKLVDEVDRQTRRIVRPHSITIIRKTLGVERARNEVFRCENVEDAQEAFSAIVLTLRKHQSKVRGQEQRRKLKSRPSARWAR